MNLNVFPVVVLEAHCCYIFFADVYFLLNFYAAVEFTK